MSERTAALVTFAGGGAIAAAAVASVWLQVAHGESVFVARLLAGLAACL